MNLSQDKKSDSLVAKEAVEDAGFGIKNFYI